MQKSELTDRQLPGLFRTLSQRKRHGVLKIQSDDHEVDVLLNDGKIIGAENPGSPISVEILRKLVAAGYVNKSLLEQPNISTLKLETLRELLVDGGIDADCFDVACRSVQLDTLHSLQRVSDCEVSFSPKVNAFSGNTSISVFPCQLLLDLVSLEQHSERYATMFSGLESGTHYIEPVAESPQGLTETERCIWIELIGGATFDELANTLMLSSLELRESLIALAELKYIKICSKESAIEEVVEPDELSLEDLEGQLDSLMADSAPPPEDEFELGALAEVADDVISEATKLLSEVHAGDSDELKLSPDPVVEDLKPTVSEKPVVEPKKSVEKPRAMQAPSLPTSSKAPAGSENFDEVIDSIVERAEKEKEESKAIFSINTWALQVMQGESFRIYLLIVSFSVLIGLGIVLPGALESWLNSLGEVTQMVDKTSI